MAVPDTTTFSLQDVVTYLTPTSNDLQTCFNEADSLMFDNRYKGSLNSLIHFRNYGPKLTLSGTVVISNETETSYDIGSPLGVDGLSTVEYQFKKQDNSFTSSWQTSNTFNYTGGVVNETDVWEVRARDIERTVGPLTVTGATLCEETTLSYNSDTGDSLDINFVAITNAGGYAFEIRELPSGSFTSVSASISGTVATISNLTPNTDYEVRAKTLNVNDAPSLLYSNTLVTATGNLPTRSFTLYHDSPLLGKNASDCTAGNYDASQTAYFYSGITTISVGDIIYTQVFPTEEVLDGRDKWFLADYGGASDSIQVSVTGEVLSITNC